MGASRAFQIAFGRGQVRAIRDDSVVARVSVIRDRISPAAKVPEASRLQKRRRTHPLGVDAVRWSHQLLTVSPTPSLFRENNAGHLYQATKACRIQIASNRYNSHRLGAQSISSGLKKGYH